MRNNLKNERFDSLSILAAWSYLQDSKQTTACFGMKKAMADLGMVDHNSFDVKTMEQLIKKLTGFNELAQLINETGVDKFNIMSCEEKSQLALKAFFMANGGKSEGRGK